MALLPHCVANNCRPVIGTTGFDDAIRNRRLLKLPLKVRHGAGTQYERWRQSVAEIAGYCCPGFG